MAGESVSINKGRFYEGTAVCVTGGTGFVGRHIVDELLKQGAYVRIPVHKRPLPLANKRIQGIQGDLLNEEDCQKIAEGIDYLFHAAGSVGAAGVGSVGQMNSIIQNLALTANILKAAWVTGVKRVLLFSSSTVYPVTDHPVREEEGWSGPVHPSYFGYGWMRRYLEKLGEFVAEKSGLQIALVRPTAVYGRHDNFNPSESHVIPALIRKAVDKTDPYIVWGSGKEVRDFLHVTDLARGCLLTLEKYATCDPVNVGSAQDMTIHELVNLILRVAGHENARVMFDDTMPVTIPYRRIDMTKANKILGFTPLISIEEGITDTLNWYKTQDKKDP